MGDNALPNATWSKESVELFNKLSQLGDDWKRIYQNTCMPLRDDVPGSYIVSVTEPGKLFEFIFFHNFKLKSMKCLVQFGPYTQGPVGYVHGGAIATMLDAVMAACSGRSGYGSLTANLNIDYIRSIPINTTALAEASVIKVDGRKAFVSGALKTVDGGEIYSKGTCIMIAPRLKSSI